MIDRRVCLVVLISLFFLGTRSNSAPVPTMTIGQNFTGSEFGVNSSALPPDCEGMVGPGFYVEYINGTFAVYSKTNGANVKRITDLKFWSDAHLTLSTDSGVSDPRVIYDPQSQRWFATMVDFDANAAGGDPSLESNDFLLAVSATSNPRGAWNGFMFQSDPDNGYFADFPTLGVDSNAVYIAGDFYQGEDNPLGPGLVSIPKSDLLLTNPTIANRTWFGVMEYSNRGDILQPVVCLDNSASGRVLATSDIGNDSDPHSNLVSFAVQNAGTASATLSSAVFVPTLPWLVPDSAYLPAPSFAPIQPDGTDTLQANEARFSANVYAVGGILYAVHNTFLNNHIAIRWYRVRAADSYLLEYGTIADTNLDMFFPSIAANALGVVVIAFDGCSITTPITAFAMAGQTINGVTTFGNRMVLQASTGSYHDLYESFGLTDTSRWGDYSATSNDPSDPNRFWTSQMYCIPGQDYGSWATQITELITVPQVVLDVARAGTNVTLSWPSAATGYQLQSTTNLTATTTVWSNVSETPLTNGAQLFVTLPASSKQQMFRLKK